PRSARGRPAVAVPGRPARRTPEAEVSVGAPLAPPRFPEAVTWRRRALPPRCRAAAAPRATARVPDRGCYAHSRRYGALLGRPHSVPAAAQAAHPPGEA